MIGTGGCNRFEMRKKPLPRAKRSKQLTPEIRREQILAAAKRCLGRVGAKAFTMKKVAEEAGVALSLISYHFDGIEGLFNALVDSIMLDEPSTKNLPPADLEGDSENLHSLIDRHFDPDYYSRENLLVWLPVYEQMLLDEHVNATMSAREDRVIKEAAIHIDDIAVFQLFVIRNTMANHVIH
jgi:AcrR family transcriptional regulator